MVKNILAKKKKNTSLTESMRESISANYDILYSLGWFAVMVAASKGAQIALE